jgi:DNA-binding CsgD family transcriptional regulator
MQVITAAKGPSGRALDRLAGYFAIALRLGSAGMCAVAGPLTDVAGIPASRLATVMVALCAWSLIFTRAVWRRGPAPALVLILKVLDAGVCAFVTKDEGSEHLVDAVLAAAENRPHVTRSPAKAILADRSSGRPALSAQERQALLLWFQGMAKSSVARRMSITENTVRQYINRARMKYAAVSRPAPSKDALLARAIEDGIIRPAEVARYTSRATRR